MVHIIYHQGNTNFKKMKFFNVDTGRMSFIRFLHKQTVVHSDGGMLFTAEKKIHGGSLNEY